MSEEKELPYCQLYINAWTTLSVIVTVVLFLMYACGTPIMGTCHWIWDLIRYFAKPII